MTSATTVSTGTRVRALARCVSVVANELLNVGLRIVDHYGLPDGSLTNNLEVVAKGMRVWIAAQQLESMTVEVFDKSKRLVRKWEIRIDYSENEQDDDDAFETQFDELEEFLKTDHPNGVSHYRVLAAYREECPIHVPGWTRTTSADASHLRAKQVSAKVVGTKYLRAVAVVYVEPLTGEPQ